MARAPTDRTSDVGRTDTGGGTEFLVVNTADTTREVSISLARGGRGWTEELSLDGGGFASVAAPGGSGPLAVVTETDQDRAVGFGFADPPMVVVDERSVDLC